MYLLVHQPHSRTGSMPRQSWLTQNRHHGLFCSVWFGFCLLFALFTLFSRLIDFLYSSSWFLFCLFSLLERTRRWIGREAGRVWGGGNMIKIYYAKKLIKYSSKNKQKRECVCLVVGLLSCWASHRLGRQSTHSCQPQHQRSLTWPFSWSPWALSIIWTL